MGKWDKKFGNLIKTLREHHRMNQSDLAKKVGVCRSAIAQWEIGNRYPEPNHLEKLSKHLNIDYQEMLTYIEPKFLNNGYQKLTGESRGENQSFQERILEEYFNEIRSRYNVTEEINSYYREGLEILLKKQPKKE